VKARKKMRATTGRPEEKENTRILAFERRSNRLPFVENSL